MTAGARRLLMGALASLAVLLATGAWADRLVVSLSSYQVAIGSNYTGAELVLFGVVERDAQSVSRPSNPDVVVTVRGPREAVTVRRKEQLGPLWINRSQEKFAAVPAVLSVMSSAPLSDIAGNAGRARLRLGLEAIVNAPELGPDRTEPNDPFRAALIRLRQKEGLWSESSRGVVFVTDNFFRAAVPLPGTAPTGNYDVEVLVLAEGTVLARGAVSFEVVKTGFEDQLTRVAEQFPLAYGAFTGLLSLAFGWLASIIFRRD